MRAHEAYRYIQQIAAQGWSPQVAIPLMMAGIGWLVGSESNPFFWAGADGMITDFHIPVFRPWTHESSAMLNRFNTSGEVPTMDRLLLGPRLVNNTELLRRLAGWNRSVFKNDMLRGNNAENSVDFQIRDSSGPRACFAVTRSIRERPLGAREMQRIAKLVPHFLHAINARRDQADGNHGDDEPNNAMPCHVLVSRSGEIIGRGDNSCRHLLELHDRPLAFGESLSHRLERLPHTALRVLDRLNRLGNGEDSRPAAEEVVTRWGRFRVSAHPLVPGDASRGDTVVLTIQPLVDRRVRRIQRLAQSSLTPGEQRIALRMADPGNGAQIAEELGISAAAYRQYAKRIYATLAVDGRLGVMRYTDC